MMRLVTECRYSGQCRSHKVWDWETKRCKV